MKLKIAAHVLCLPLCLVAFNVAVVYLWLALSLRISLPEVPGVLIILPFLAYAFTYLPWAIAYILFCQGVLLANWLTSRLTTRQRFIFAGYNAVVLIFIGYDVWWYVTGQTYRIGMGYL